MPAPIGLDLMRIIRILTTIQDMSTPKLLRRIPPSARRLDACRRRALLGTGLALWAPLQARGVPPATSSLPPLAAAPPVGLPGTHQVDLMWAGRARRLFVAIPGGPVPAQGYPVLWALDGNTTFPLLAALLYQRAARPADLRKEQPVVVGLGYPGDAAYDQPARAEDLTLPRAARTSADGQADRTLDLLQRLRPWLAEQLPLDPASQTLFGHSFGGLFALYALFSRPTLFQRHLAASPSIWWGDRAILDHRDAYLRRPAAVGDGHLLVTAGGLEEDLGASAGTGDTERQRRQQARRQISSARELVASLVGSPGLRAEFRLLHGEDHGSLLAPSAALALDLAVSRDLPRVHG